MIFFFFLSLLESVCIIFCPTGRTGRSSSRGSSSERSPSANPFVRAGTLKAMKEEQDRLRAEEEERERAKAEKRSKSAAKNVCTLLYKGVTKI